VAVIQQGPIVDWHVSGPTISNTIVTPTSAEEVVNGGFWLDREHLMMQGVFLSVKTTGVSAIIDGSTLNVQCQDGGLPFPATLENDGTMYVGGATLMAGELTGHGIIDGYAGSVIHAMGAQGGETVELQSAHLYIGNGNFPSQAGNWGMQFLAPITQFNSHSSIFIEDTVATSEVFAKTGANSGVMMLFNHGVEVANLHISGSPNVYATETTVGGAPAVMLTATNTGHILPVGMMS
jgi:hypothetical protein